MKTLKGIVPIGGAGLMKALVLSMFFVGFLFLNSYADDGQDLIEAAKRGDTASVNANLDVKAGKKIYDAECAVCHGKTGAGDGPASASLKPKPTDFTDKAKLSKSNDQLFKSISDGIKNTAMPSYANKLSEEDRQVVIAYIRTFSISAYGQEGVGTDIPIAQPAKSTPSQTTTPSQTKDLIEATMSGNTARIKTLLKMGADVNEKDKYGETALMYASDEGHTETVKALLAKGADVNTKNQYEQTALIRASMNGHTEIAKLLIAKGADVNANDIFRQTALILASFNGYDKVVEVLLAKGADVNTKADYHTFLIVFKSWTALMVASYNARDKVVKVLLANGADVNAKNDKGETALMWASKKGYSVIVQLLKKAGAKE